MRTQVAPIESAMRNWGAKSRRKAVYLSGPMSGLPDFNKQAFMNAEARLNAAGIKVVNPVKNGVPADAEWSEHMRADISMLMTCAQIAMLPGWQNSKGAKLELHIAKQLGIAVTTVEELES